MYSNETKEDFLDKAKWT